LLEASSELNGSSSRIQLPISHDGLRAYVVWLPMFPGDSQDWANTRSNEFSDQRLNYYWDGNRLTGLQWQKVLGTSRAA